MKKYQMVGLLLSMIILVSGSAGFIANWFSGVSGNPVRTETIVICWLLAGIGIWLYVLFLLLTLASIYKISRLTPIAEEQLKRSISGQIVFSFLNTFLGGFLFSTIFALAALSNAVNARHEANRPKTENLLKTAKTLNILAVVMVGIQYLVLLSVMIAAFSKFFGNFNGIHF